MINFTAFDAELNRLEACIRMARECGFSDLVTTIIQELIYGFIPLTTRLVDEVPHHQREEADQRLKRMKGLVKGAVH